MYWHHLTREVGYLFKKQGLIALFLSSVLYSFISFFIIANGHLQVTLNSNSQKINASVIFKQDQTLDDVQFLINKISNSPLLIQSTLFTKQEWLKGLSSLNDLNGNEDMLNQLPFSASFEVLATDFSKAVSFLNELSGRVEIDDVIYPHSTYSKISQFAFFLNQSSLVMQLFLYLSVLGLLTLVISSTIKINTPTIALFKTMGAPSFLIILPHLIFVFIVHTISFFVSFLAINKFINLTNFHLGELDQISQFIPPLELPSSQIIFAAWAALLTLIIFLTLGLSFKLVRNINLAKYLFPLVASALVFSNQMAYANKANPQAYPQTNPNKTFSTPYELELYNRTQKIRNEINLIKNYLNIHKSQISELSEQTVLYKKSMVQLIIKLNKIKLELKNSLLSDHGDQNKHSTQSKYHDLLLGHLSHQLKKVSTNKDKINTLSLEHDKRKAYLLKIEQNLSDELHEIVKHTPPPVTRASLIEKLKASLTPQEFNRFSEQLKSLKLHLLKDSLSWQVKGLPPQALLSGHVTEKFTHPYFGQTLVVNHDNNFYSVYLGLPPSALKISDPVTTGMPLTTSALDSTTTNPSAANSAPMSDNPNSSSSAAAAPPSSYYYWVQFFYNQRQIPLNLLLSKGSTNEKIL